MIILSVIWLGSGELCNAASRHFPAVFKISRFIAYTPRHFSVVNGRVTPATATGIQSDLKRLRPHFDGLVTYASVNGVEKTPEIAAQLGFRAVIMGIWDPASEAELQNVIQMVSRYPKIIAAVIVGNEGIYARRYQAGDVEKTIQKIKTRYPDLPVSTSEPFFLYLKTDYVKFFSSNDFLAPNVHPVFEKWFKPENPVQGVEMVIQIAEQLKSGYGKPILIKETGMPSGPESQGYSPIRQNQFWTALFQRIPAAPNLSVVCFEAFDAPWKPGVMAETFPGDHSSEAFWGFFSSDGKPKPVVMKLKIR
jgi:exo-beta-1,3-glucanase (GH17 family)